MGKHAVRKRTPIVLLVTVGSLLASLGWAEPRSERLLPWGSAPGHVGLQPELEEQRADGPSAVALSDDGSVLILDRLNNRLLRYEPGALETGAASVMDVPGDAEALAAGPDRSVALYSPLRARIWLYQDGKERAEREIPRALRQLRSISIAPSGDLLASTAYQETYVLGAADSAPSLREILHSKREGAVLATDGSGLAVRLRPDKRPELLRLRAGGRAGLQRSERGRARAWQESVLVLERPALAARIVGVQGDLVCLHLEERGDGPDSLVARRLSCFALDSGRQVFERRLPQAWAYLPRRSIAIGGGAEPGLAFINPEPGGLRVVFWRLPGKGEVER